ncbi:ferric reductase-like transmembrane domain-containing protein [Neobacillus drentensis]|uniref:ferric reductase-like transmembrane domain-containing protein n=1 Tax=Neobacillus drentensis TaxID=220684 RepID=UPI002FFF7583
MNELVSVWTLIRTSGFLAYYFMTLSLVFGLLSSFAIMKKKKTLLISLHKKSSWYGLLTIIFHMILIWQDQYAPYTLAELLLPFRAENEPLFSTFGILSFYLFLLVMASSDFLIKKLGFNRWKKIHLAVIPAWLFMLIHGFAIGTDSSEAWALSIYLISSSIICVLMLIRVIESMMLRQSSGRHNLKS